MANLNITIKSCNDIKTTYWNPDQDPCKDSGTPDYGLGMDGPSIHESTVLYKSCTDTSPAAVGYYLDGTDNNIYYWDGSTITLHKC